TISSPLTWRLFTAVNRDRAYSTQIKPFNFLSVAYVSTFERPEHEPHVVLVAPYERDPTRWLNTPWYNRYTGSPYRITTQDTHGEALADAVRVKTYADVLGDYRTHPEAKSVDIIGQPCRRTTKGLLQRRPVTLRSITHIGKES